VTWLVCSKNVTKANGTIAAWLETEQKGKFSCGRSVEPEACQGDETFSYNGPWRSKREGQDRLEKRADYHVRGGSPRVFFASRPQKNRIGLLEGDADVAAAVPGEPRAGVVATGLGGARLCARR